MQKKNTNGQKPKVFLECLVGSGFVCVIIIRALIIVPASQKAKTAIIICNAITTTVFSQK